MNRTHVLFAMGLLSDTYNFGLRMHREGGELMRHSRGVMYVGIANPRWRE